MPKHVLLNNVDHQEVKVLSKFAADLGDNIASVLVYPTEFVELQKEYTIVFRKDEQSHKFSAAVLLGLQKGENLYLDPKSHLGWAANYIPSSVIRGPFLIGFQQQQENGQTISTPVVHMDMDHPKVNSADGEALFLQNGGNSDYLQQISTRLMSIHQGMLMQDTLFELLSEMQLIEAVNIDFDLSNGEKHRLLGNYTINEEKLAALDIRELDKLHKSGLLPLVYAVIASITNVKNLIDTKNQRLA